MPVLQLGGCGVGQISPWSYRDVVLPTRSGRGIFSTHKMKHVAISGDDAEEVQPRS